MKNTFEQFKTFYENLPIAIEIYDKTGMFLDCNEICLKLFGVIDKNQLFSFNLFDDPNIPPHELLELKKGNAINYMTHFDFNKVIEEDLYATNFSGRKYLGIMIQPYYILKECTGYTVVIYDLSTLVIKNIDLENQKILANKMFWNAPIGLVLLNKNGSIIDLNNQFETITKISRDDLLQISIYEIIKEDFKDSIKEILDSLINHNSEIVRFKTMLIEKLDYNVYVQFHCKIIENNDFFHFIICFIEDISYKITQNANIGLLTNEFDKLKDSIEKMQIILHSANRNNENNYINNTYFTKREKTIIPLLKTGSSTKEIAFNLHISESAIKKNLSSLFLKTKTTNRYELIKFLMIND
ncbi:MAG: hypothetical protein A2015_01050 [Spirochaetes bacterium GWF1_31_7]|nr:MAG: hypothetical protein A2Y30_00950 [Spirochaetes bacterium GWE1_32_154]OHD47886.1 MAG: hypothetical protein A2015_01050 [Spirochaetes bacterium GWF1_31_7]OHD48878.1 MAG: hypothetical protein A2Y29_16765 [Spirochaetes bacterium GWE2_31_10]OHD74739.1 MAG: hypothetical protein A2355_03340 [Spirochaetes bacterium RIFOXYB1_FULL_32_8]HBD94858.1 hypothetical protein [Spirochaetia bacterium]